MRAVQKLSSPYVVCLLLAISFMLGGLALAQSKSIFSPIVDVDPTNGFLFVSNGGKILVIQAGESAKAHVGKLPVGGMIDIKIEYQEGKKFPILQSWKLVGGESDCKVFNGTTCK